MTDLRTTIAPKSDQCNYDDFIGGRTRTITVTKVSKVSGDQPISINFDGDEGKPYKPCKSMRRVLVALWGDQGTQYVGRSMTLYGDPTVKFGGSEVGGIRISHVSHIDKPVTMALTATRASRKPYTVQPLRSGGAEASMEESQVMRDARALKTEIPLADTSEKLAMIEQRCAAIGELLIADNLGKWNDALLDMLEKQRNAVGSNPIFAG